MRLGSLNLPRIAPPRLGLVISLAVSICIHLSALAWLGLSGRGPISAEAMSDGRTETVLTFADPPPEPPAPDQQPIPPQADPIPEPQPVPELTSEPPPAVPIQAAPPAAPRKPPPPPPPPPRPVPAPIPKNTVFAGVQARRAQRVVYVVDASGPMASSLAFVKGELARSITGLDSDQAFQVLFFREAAGPATRASDPGFLAFQTAGSSPQLISATSDAKKHFQEWLSTIRPTGRSNPQPALEESLRLRPDLIFVLSRRIKRTNLADAAGEARQVLAALDRLNPPDALSGRRPVVIKTIQFLDDDPSGMLQAIAQTHGDGPDSYKLLTLNELAVAKDR